MSPATQRNATTAAAAGFSLSGCEIPARRRPFSTRPPDSSRLDRSSLRASRVVAYRRATRELRLRSRASVGVSSVGCLWKRRVGRNVPRAALFHLARFRMMARLAGAVTPQLAPISQNDRRVRATALSPKPGMREYCLPSANLLALRASIELGPHKQIRWDCGCPGHLVEDP